MAAKGRPTGKAHQKKGKGIGGRMPVKRSINLVLVDENKINPLTAALGILLIVALAFAFGKYMVADRLIEVSKANGEVARLQKTLDDTLAAIEDYGEIEATYAHYTYEGMTKQETSRIDRTLVIGLVSDIIREQDNLFDMNAYEPRLTAQVTALADTTNPRQALYDFRRYVKALGDEVKAYREQVLTWSLSENILTVELTGKSLANLNKLARLVEKNPIVDSCALSTAKKDSRSKRLTSVPTGVRGKFIIYLVKPAEEVASK